MMNSKPLKKSKPLTKKSKPLTMRKYATYDF